jgi:signal transduction histidine kinase
MIRRLLSRLRSPSLFWTFAGSFLLVLIIAGLLQGFAIVSVVKPIASAWTRERAGSIARDTARKIAAIADSEDFENEVREILPSHGSTGSALFVVYRGLDGRVIPDRFVPPQALRMIEFLLRFAPDRFQDGGSPDRPWPGPPGRGQRRGPDSRLRPGSRDRMGPGPQPEGEEQPPGPPGRGRRPRAPRFQLLSHHPVEHAGEVIGHVIVLGPRERFGLSPPPAFRHLFLFLPIAVLLAGAAGLIMFRLLLRRLRALEALATRVTEGDLEARVSDPGPDEIGRLGDRLNRMTERLAEARQGIEESNRQRRQLLADISHELGTPLTSIRGYAETLLDPAVPVSEEERASYVRNVLDEAKRLDLLTQDLFDLTRLEAGAIQLNWERLDWAALCRNTIHRFEVRFRDAGLVLEWLGSEEEAWITADGRRLEQVLENLLVNALRYVPAGGTVSLSLAGAGSGDSERFRLVVSDDGPGIPPEPFPPRDFHPGRATGLSGCPARLSRFVQPLPHFCHISWVLWGERRKRAALRSR